MCFFEFNYRILFLVLYIVFKFYVLSSDTKANPKECTTGISVLKTPSVKFGRGTTDCISCCFAKVLAFSHLHLPD